MSSLFQDRIIETKWIYSNKGAQKLKEGNHEMKSQYTYEEG